MKRPFYIELVEHNFRLAVRLRYEQIQGEVSRQWHRDTTKWLSTLSTEDRELIEHFYTCNQTMYKCVSYRIRETLEQLAADYAAEMQFI